MYFVFLANAGTFLLVFKKYFLQSFICMFSWFELHLGVLLVNYGMSRQEIMNIYGYSFHIFCAKI